MLIIIPSYRRTDILAWVVKSVIACDLSMIAERKLVVIVNNDPGSRDVVDKILDDIADSGEIMCHAIHRTESIPAIDSWYSAIADLALDGEAVFLLGDDDLMLPWGLRNRYFEIVRSNADMLLSDFVDRIYFFERGTRYWMPGMFPEEDREQESACPWEFFPAKHPEASFMSNHCYRNTPAFRRGLALAFSWTDSQTWLERKVRLSMLPFYLPYAIAIGGGRVYSYAAKCVIRGAVADEAIVSSYTDGGSIASYNLCAFDVFANRALPQYDENMAKVCSLFRPTIITNFLTILLDKDISRKALMTTFRHAGLKYSDLISVDVLRGAFTFCVGLLGLRGARLRLRRRSKSLRSTERFFRDHYAQGNASL